MSTIFSDIDAVDICSEKQYKNDTGNILDDTYVTEKIIDVGTFETDIENKSKELDKHSITYDKISDDKASKVDNNHKGLGIINTSANILNNGFIKSVQNKEAEKQKQEAIDLYNADTEFPYIKAKLLTDAELQLFHFMENNLCQIERIAILPKVRLGDIVELDKRITTDMKYFWKVTNKHVDFLICRRDTMEPICVVELDDYTHDNPKAKERDQFVMQVLKTAGIETARITTKIIAVEKKDLMFIDELINMALAPKCPNCGGKMFPKISRTGHRFYACGDFINCRYTVDIDPRGERLP